MAVAGVVDDQEMVGPGVLEKRDHPGAKLDIGVGYSWDAPLFGVVVVFLAEDFLEGEKLRFDRRVLLPPQQQDGHGGIGGFAALAVDEHGGILQMAGEGLEIMALRHGGGCVLGGKAMLGRNLR